MQVTQLAFWLQFLANFAKIIEIGAFVFGAYQFWMGRRERRAADKAVAERALIDSNYQAWQVINSAQGKGGSGGRIDALGDLLRNHVSLAGINLDGAWLEKVQLPGATLAKASLQRANLTAANLSHANLDGADLRDVDLVGADLSGASMRGADLTGARLSAARLDGATIRDIIGWQDVRSWSHASVVNVRQAPLGFVAFAIEQGASDRSSPTLEDNTGAEFSQHFRTV